MQTDITNLITMRQVCSGIGIDEGRAIYKAYVICFTKKLRFTEETLKKLGVDRSASSCRAFIKELRRAAEKGYTLEEYIEKGRPFKYGNEVIAKKHK